LCGSCNAAQCQTCVNAFGAQVFADNSLWWLNRQWSKTALTYWLRLVGRALDLDHYLLPPPRNPQPAQPQPQPQPQDAAGEAGGSSQTDASQSQVDSDSMTVGTADAESLAVAPATLHASQPFANTVESAHSQLAPAAEDARTYLLLQRSAVGSGPEGTHHQNLNPSQQAGGQGGLSHRQVQAEGSLSGNADASSSASSSDGTSHAAQGTLFTPALADAVRQRAQHPDSSMHTSPAAVSATSDLQHRLSPQQQLSRPEQASCSEGFSRQVGYQIAHLTSSNNQDELLYICIWQAMCSMGWVARLFTASAGSPGQ